ncbi:hypothetical protein H2198_001812 [Neophaeococcomyces mojaviensis]|uniref:Uncharacterized protein n=1 Tax=Neophaeococcomyces mojaviensis TaxID=3383035 RepID=A0ACC3AFU6_9EURO|nr:hypothetical protein H2198_001812 [Knufia sp. JES_112]
MPIPLLVTVQAAPGKEARVTELARYITDEVQKNEPAVTQYEAYKTTDKEGHVDIMIFFQIANEEELEKRMSLEHHRIVQKALKEEGLMRAPLKYQRLDEVGSFTR